MTVIGFAHPGIVVDDLERGRRFYEQMFGFEVIAREDWEKGDVFYDQGTGLKGSSARGYVLKGHNCYLELFEYLSPGQTGPDPGTLGANERGIRHLAFYVEDISAEIERLQQLGGACKNPPAGNEDVGFVAYCRDPFGNIIELTTVGGPARPLEELPAIGGGGNG